MTAPAKRRWNVDETKLDKLNSLQAAIAPTRRAAELTTRIAKYREDTYRCFDAAVMYEAHGNHEKAATYFDHAANHERIGRVLAQQVIRLLGE